MSAVPHADQHVKANDEIEAIETALGVDLANVVQTSALDTDPLLAADSNTRVATQKAVKAYADNIVITGGGIPIGYLDTDGALTANSDTKVPSQKAVRTYVAASVPTAVSGATFTNLTAIPVGAGVIPAANLPAISSVTRGTFGSASLSTAGALAITHSAELAAPYQTIVFISDSTGATVIPDSIVGTAGTVTVTLSSAAFGTIAGTWGYALVT
jgi:hypothetical protein